MSSNEYDSSDAIGKFRYYGEFILFSFMQMMIVMIHIMMKQIHFKMIIIIIIQPMLIRMILNSLNILLVNLLMLQHGLNHPYFHHPTFIPHRRQRYVRFVSKIKQISNHQYVIMLFVMIVGHNTSIQNFNITIAQVKSYHLIFRSYICFIIHLDYECMKCDIRIPNK